MVLNRGRNIFSILNCLIFVFIGNCYAKQQYECNEIIDNPSYKRSCCTIFNFHSEDDQYKINGIEKSGINKIIFIDSKPLKIPWKIFQTNPKIMTLDISNGSVSSIQRNDLFYASNLNYLILLSNKINIIEKTSFREANRLHLLNLRNNLIREIKSGAFDTLEFLSDLYLDNNQLEIIHEKLFSQLKRLFRLTLSNNRIKILDPKIIYGSPKLDHLNLKGNNLEGELILKSIFNDLTFIDVSNNHLQKLEIICEQYKELKTLFLTVIARGNQLIQVDISRNYTLTALNLYDNLLTQIDDIIKGHTSLTHLNIGRNPLSTIDSQVFESTSKLSYLNISDTYLKSLSKELFKPIQKIGILDVSGNNLSSNVIADLVEYLSELELLKITCRETKQQNGVNEITTLRKSVSSLRCSPVVNTSDWTCFMDKQDLDEDSNSKIQKEYFPAWRKMSLICSLILLLLISGVGIWIKRSQKIKCHEQLDVNVKHEEIEPF